MRQRHLLRGISFLAHACDLEIQTRGPRPLVAAGGLCWSNRGSILRFWTHLVQVLVVRWRYTLATYRRAFGVSRRSVHDRILLYLRSCSQASTR
jgi:hypothetical protein